MKRDTNQQPSGDGLLHAGGVRKLVFLVVCIVGVLIGALLQPAQGGAIFNVPLP